MTKQTSAAWRAKAYFGTNKWSNGRKVRVDEWNDIWRLWWKHRDIREGRV